MKKSIWLWIIAFILTVFTAAYQRITGPTYPVDGEIIVGEELIEYKLDRTHGGDSDHPIEINVKDETICGELYWKRYKTNDYENNSTSSFLSVVSSNCFWTEQYLTNQHEGPH